MHPLRAAVLAFSCIGVFGLFLILQQNAHFYLRNRLEYRIKLLRNYGVSKLKCVIILPSDTPVFYPAPRV